MKFLNVVRALLLLTIGLLASGRVRGQVWIMSVSNTPSITLSNNITYFINVTNLTGSTLNTTVTDSFPATAAIISFTNNLAATTSNSPGQIVFFLPGFDTVPLQVELVLQPASSGPFTNTVAIGSPIITNTLTTNTVTQVGSLSTTLSVSATLPTNTVLVNDWVTYDVTVTNPGANSATGVVLSNTLPTGATLISVSPTNAAYTLTNGAMVFNLGTLASQAGETLAITVQPTVAGTNTFVDELTSSRSFPVTVTNNLTVRPFDTSQMTAVNTSAMNYDPQNGLMEQTIQLTDTGTNTISAARVVVSGLSNVTPTLANQLLFDAVGTNNGNPYVQYNGTLTPGQNVSLTLKYDPKNRTAFTVANSQYAAVPVSAASLAPPSGTPFAITLITNLPSGNVMIEFQATTGKSYTVIYANNPAMTNALAAQPAVVAPASEVQWIDFGPPETISTPASTNSRFYQVILNQ